MQIPGLRSPYDKVGGIFYLGRLIDKIRLHQAGTLPADYHANLGKGFDARCARLLQVEYNDLLERVKQGGTDDEILASCRKPNDETVEVWNGFMRKIGWRDGASEILARRKKEAGLEGRDDIQAIFDFLDADEDRPVRPWQSA